jgi:hypothetical protein
MAPLTPQDMMSCPVSHSPGTFVRGRSQRARIRAESWSSPYNSPAGEPVHAAPPRRCGLFERITGRLRRQDDENFPAQRDDWHAQGADRADAREPRRDAREDFNSHDYQVDVPVFFGTSKKRV